MALNSEIFVEQNSNCDSFEQKTKQAPMLNSWQCLRQLEALMKAESN